MITSYFIKKKVQILAAAERQRSHRSLPFEQVKSILILYNAADHEALQEGIKRLKAAHKQVQTCLFVASETLAVLPWMTLETVAVLTPSSSAMSAILIGLFSSLSLIIDYYPLLITINIVAGLKSVHPDAFLHNHKSYYHSHAFLKREDEIYVRDA